MALFKSKSTLFSILLSDYVFHLRGMSTYSLKIINLICKGTDECYFSSISSKKRQLKARDLVVVEISDHIPLRIRFTSGQKAIDYLVLLGLSNTEVNVCI